MTTTRPRTVMSLAAEAEFRGRIARLGAVVLGEYRDVHSKVHCRCAAGHDCHPTPHGVRRGSGICVTCAKRDPVVAEMQFRERLDELGAKLLDPYSGSNTRHRVVCAAGHDLYLRPGVVQAARLIGRGICVTCTGKGPGVTEAAFRRRLAELGAVPLYETWLGIERPHRARCAAGHACSPRPGDVQQGQGICKTCANRDPAAAEAAFRARLADLGATLLEPEWLGARRAHRVRCAQGHICSPKPNNVSQGHHACRFCAANASDTFYVVAGEPGVKFGITTGRGRHRLMVHAADGYTETIRLMTGLPGTAALDTENAVKTALILAREKPTRGREYFPTHCLALILDVADSWLTVPTVAPCRYVQDMLFAA